MSTQGSTSQHPLVIDLTGEDTQAVTAPVSQLALLNPRAVLRQPRFEIAINYRTGEIISRFVNA